MKRITALVAHQVVMLEGFVLVHDSRFAAPVSV